MRPNTRTSDDAAVRSFSRLLGPRYWPTWLGLGVLRLSLLLPFPALLAAGRALGVLLRRLPLRFV